MRQRMAKPFLKWAGGKGQLIQTLDSMLPLGFGDWPNVTYIEPFVGGGAMLFHVMQKYGNIRRAVINDLNANLTTAYKTIKTSPSELIASLKKIKSDYNKSRTEEAKKEFYLEMRRRYNEEDLSDLERTVCLIFLNKTCFNGLYRENSKGHFNVPFGRYPNPMICDEETIWADSQMLQRVEIISGDFEGTEQYVFENTLVYFDPPYRPLDNTSSFNSYSKEAFNDEEQKRLKRYFDRLSAKGCLMMLSNSDCRGRNNQDTFFDDLYEDYIIDRVYAVRSINANPLKRGRLTELLIRNYNNTVLFGYAEGSYRRTV